MSNVSIAELQDAIERAGLPVSDYKAMRAATPFARYAIQSSVYGGDSSIGQMDEERKKKIAKIAEVDQRLGKLYGDPSSSLFIENPTARENLLSGAQNIGYRTVQSIIDKMAQREKELSGQSSDLLTFFKDLTAVNKPESTAAASGDLDFESLLSGYNNTEASDSLDKLLEEFNNAG